MKSTKYGNLIVFLMLLKVGLRGMDQQAALHHYLEEERLPDQEMPVAPHRQIQVASDDEIQVDPRHIPVAPVNWFQRVQANMQNLLRGNNREQIPPRQLLGPAEEQVAPQHIIMPPPRVQVEQVYMGHVLPNPVRDFLNENQAQDERNHQMADLNADNLIKSCYFAPEMQFILLQAVNRPFIVNVLTGQVANLPTIQEILNIHAGPRPELKRQALHIAMQAIQTAKIVASLQAAAENPQYIAFAPNISYRLIPPAADYLKRALEQKELQIKDALRDQSWIEFAWSLLPSFGMVNYNSTGVINPQPVQVNDINHADCNNEVNQVTLSNEIMSYIIKIYNYKTVATSERVARLLFQQCLLAQQTIYNNDPIKILSTYQNSATISINDYIYDHMPSFDQIVEQIKSHVNQTENQVIRKRQAYNKFLQIRIAVQTAIYLANCHSSYYKGYVIPNHLLWLFDGAISRLMNYEKILSQLCVDQRYGGLPEDRKIDNLFSISVKILGAIGVAYAVTHAVGYVAGYEELWLDLVGGNRGPVKGLVPGIVQRGLGADKTEYHKGIRRRQLQADLDKIIAGFDKVQNFEEHNQLLNKLEQYRVTHANDIKTLNFKIPDREKISLDKSIDWLEQTTTKQFDLYGKNYKKAATNPAAQKALSELDTRLQANLMRQNFLIAMKIAQLEEKEAAVIAAADNNALDDIEKITKEIEKYKNILEQPKNNFSASIVQSVATRPVVNSATGIIDLVEQPAQSAQNYSLPSAMQQFVSLANNQQDQSTQGETNNESNSSAQAPEQNNSGNKDQEKNDGAQENTQEFDELALKGLAGGVAVVTPAVLYKFSRPEKSPKTTNPNTGSTSAGDRPSDIRLSSVADSTPHSPNQAVDSGPNPSDKPSGSDVKSSGRKVKPWPVRTTEQSSRKVLKPAIRGSDVKSSGSKVKPRPVRTTEQSSRKVLKPAIQGVGSTDNIQVDSAVKKVDPIVKKVGPAAKGTGQFVKNNKGKLGAALAVGSSLYQLDQASRNGELEDFFT